MARREELTIHGVQREFESGARKPTPAYLEGQAAARAAFAPGAPFGSLFRVFPLWRQSPKMLELFAGYCSVSDEVKRRIDARWGDK